MSSRQWKKLGDVLEPSHRVVAPDLLGSGENPPWPSESPFEFSMDVDAVEKIVDGLGDKVHLVGHSYGGLIALTLARRSPHKLRSIAVYDPVAFGVLYEPHDAEGLADLGRAGDNLVFLDSARGGNDEWFEAFVDYWNGPGSWRALPAPARDGFLRVGRKVFYEVSSLMHDRTPASAYANITVPALLMTGEKSPAAAQRVIARLGAALPNAKTLSVQGAGHMGPITHGGVVNAALKDHFARAV